MATIWQLLEALPAHLAGVAPSQAAAESACQAAEQLLVLAKTQQGFDAEQSRRLER